MKKIIYLCLAMMGLGCDEPSMIVLMGSGGNSCAKCGNNQTCENGECKDKIDDPCAKCTAGQTCEDGVCKDNVGQCTGDNCNNGCKCADGKTCVDGTCVDKVDDPCAKCTENQTCDDGVCKDKDDDPCAKCDVDQTCENGECKNKELPCECSDNQVCEEGKCIDRPEDPCAKCTENQICEAGTCKDKVNPCDGKCDIDKCNSGDCVCNTSDDCYYPFECRGNMCVENPCLKCINEGKNCDENEKCVDIKPNICTDNSCASGCTCPEGEKCNGKICVETCNLNERRCSEDSTTLERCKEDETWGKIRCQKWDYCSQEFGNVCVHKLAENVEGGECKEGASICASNTELLVCVNGAFVSKDCKIAKTGVSPDKMRCTINDNSGGGECVELLGGNTDECAYDEVGYLRCAGQNKGVRKCNPSDGKWKWIGGNCGGENKCIYVFEDDRAAAVCEDGCVEETYECDDNKIMKCVNKKWRVITNCSDFGSKCVSDTKSARCQ